MEDTDVGVPTHLTGFFVQNVGAEHRLLFLRVIEQLFTLKIDFVAGDVRTDRTPLLDLPFVCFDSFVLRHSNTPKWPCHSLAV